MERNEHGLVEETHLANVWRNWEEPRKENSSRCADCDLRPQIPEYESEMLTDFRRHSVLEMDGKKMEKTELCEVQVSTLRTPRRGVQAKEC